MKSVTMRGLAQASVLMLFPSLVIAQYYRCQGTGRTYAVGSLTRYVGYCAPATPAEPPGPFNDHPTLGDVAHVWRMDEVSGARADVVGGYDLTDNNTVGSVTGKDNLAASFVAASSEYLSRADGGSGDDLRLAGDFTVSTWVNPTAHAATQMFFTKDYDVSRGYAFYHRTDQKVNVQLPTTAGMESLVSDDLLTDGAFNHIVIDYTSSSKVIGVRINGGTRKTLILSNQTVASTAPFELGREAYPGFPFHFTGAIDETAVWLRAHRPGVDRSQ